MPVLGFSVGNENSYVATVKSGGIEVIDNEYNLRSTPTYVAFTEKSRDIGIAAKTKVITNLENTVFGFKKILGRKLKDPVTERELSYLPYEECELPSADIGFKVNYLKKNIIFTVDQLMAMMLTKLKTISEVKLGNVRDCVISVPVYYTDAQRRAMLNAARIANLNALKLMNESTAVALLYGFYKQGFSDEPQNIIFVDLGNSSLTVTACAFTKEKLKILGCVWNDVGGRDFDNKLVQYFIADFKDKYKLDVSSSKKAIMTLMLECESLKKLMSANSLELRMQIECFMQDKDVSGRMKREMFENLSAPVLNKIENTLQKILEKTELKINDIHSVEIVGGSCRVPAVKYLIQKVFGKEPNATLNQDEAVARGCALQCALLSPSLKTRNFVIDDIHSHSIKISWMNKEFKTEEIELFSSTDKVPSRKMVTLCMSQPFSVDVYYDDSYVPLTVRKIGTFAFENIPYDICDEFIRIKIEVCLDIHGIFSIVSAKLLAKNERVEKIVPEESSKGETEALGNISASEEEDAKTNRVSHELSIISDVLNLSDKVLNEFIDKEQQMIKQDVKETEQANARNAFEEYVYEMREKLSDKLQDFVSENDKDYLLKQLNEAENWLYDNENESALEYSKKLNFLKMNFGPVFKRCEEWEERAAVVAEYLQVLQHSLDIISKIQDSRENINIQENVENLRKMYLKYKNYLEGSLDVCSKFTKYDDVPVTASELRNALNKYKSDFRKTYQEIQSKITQESSTSYGDGKSAQEEKESVISRKENEEGMKTNEHFVNDTISMSQE